MNKNNTIHKNISLVQHYFFGQRVQSSRDASPPIIMSTLNLLQYIYSIIIILNIYYCHYVL